MIISELEKHLKSIKEAHGDIEIVINDADTNWLFKITDSDLGVLEDDEGVRLEIGADYSSETFGA